MSLSSLFQSLIFRFSAKTLKTQILDAKHKKILQKAQQNFQQKLGYCWVNLSQFYHTLLWLANEASTCIWLAANLGGIQNDEKSVSKILSVFCTIGIKNIVKLYFF